MGRRFATRPGASAVALLPEPGRRPFTPGLALPELTAFRPPAPPAQAPGFSGASGSASSPLAAFSAAKASLLASA